MYKGGLSYVAGLFYSLTAMCFMVPIIKIFWMLSIFSAYICGEIAVAGVSPYSYDKGEKYADTDYFVHYRTSVAD